MEWFGRHITPWNNTYNCTMNDPLVYAGRRGMRRFLSKIRYEINRRILKKLLGNSQLPHGIIVSERTIEIPLAVDFLDRYVKDDPVMELGCVMPYYVFTGEKHVVYDLLDPHPANTRRDLRELTDDEYKTNVLSISTLEHVNLSDLGIRRNSITATDVLSRILANAKKYFVTFPLGYNPTLDRFVQTNISDAVFVTRRNDDMNKWIVVKDPMELTEHQKKFGGYCCANTICVVTNCRT